MVTDPVCLTEVDERVTDFKSEYRGKRYYFHSDRCRLVFERNPEDYVGAIPEKAYGDHHRREHKV